MRAGSTISSFIIVFLGLIFALPTKAQITGISYPAAACANSSINVTFTPAAGVDGPFALHLIPGTGSPIALGTAPGSPASVTIPTSVSTGSYKIRVTTPSDTAVGAANISITALPAVPGVTTPVEACAGAPITLSATGSNLKWYAPGGAALPSAPTTAPATPGAHAYSVSQSTGTCEGPKATLTVNVTAAPPVPTLNTAAAPAPVCVGTTVAPTVFTGAITAGAGDLVWYSSNTGGSPLAPAEITVNTSTPGTKSLYVARRVGDCESARLKVDLVVKPIPSATTITDINVCVGSTLTAANIVAGVANPENYTLKWYTAPSGGTGVATPTPPATTSASSTTFHVSRTNDGCEGERQPLTVTVSALPATPALASGPLAAVCVGTTVAPSVFTSAIASGTGTLVWYSSASGGTPLAPAAITVSTTTAGTKSLYVARRNAEGCESPRLKVDLVVKANPAAPGVTKLDVCVGDTPAPVLTATGTNLKWYTTGGAALPSAPTISTAAAATFSYQVTQTVDGCESPKATAQAQVYKTANPTVTASIAYCKDETPAALTATGTALKWYTAATGGTGTTTPPTVSTATVGTVAYYVTQTLNGCESDRARIDVRTKAVPVAPTVTDLNDVCQATAVPATQLLAAVSGATGTLKWYTAATGGTGTTTAPTPVTTTAGVKNFYVTQSVEACESPRAKIELDVKALPAAPTVTATVDFCHQATATALTATPTGSNTLKWYTVATGGTASSTAPVPSTTTVQTVSYYVSQSQAYSTTLSCEGPRAKIDAVINPLPVVATTTDQVVCQTRTDQTLDFKATTTAATNTLVWFPNSTSTTQETATPNRNLKTAGEFEYYVAQKSNKSCVGQRKVVKIRVKRLPGLPGVSNLEYCQFENAPALTATPETNATLNWYGLNATGGTPSANAPKPSTEEGGTYSFYVSQTLEACEGDRAELKVLVKTTPKPETSTSISYCHNEPATPLTATGQRLKWYRPNGESQNNPFTPFTAAVGDQFFYVTQTGDNNCESPKQEIKITVHPLPSATISGQSSIPLGGRATIQVSFTGLAPWSYTLSNGYKGTTETSPVNIEVQPAFTTSYLVTEVSNTCGKGIPNGSAVVTVLRPTITTGNPSAANICAGAELTVPFQSSGDFPAGSSFVLQLGKEDKNESYKTIPGTHSGNTIQGIIPDTLAGGVYYLRVINSNQNPELNTIGSTSGVTITVDPKPTAILPADRSIYVGQSTTLSITLTGASPWTFSYSDGVEKNSVTTSTSPYTLTVNPAETTVYTVTEITNRCGTGRSIGETRVQVDQILGREPTNANWAKVLPTLVNDECRVELDVADYNDIELNVTDMSGRLIRKQPLVQEVTPVDLSNAASGIYFFRIRKQKELTIIKVVKP